MPECFLWAIFAVFFQTIYHITIYMTNLSFPSFIAKWSVAAALLNITTISMAQQTPLPTMRANDKVLRIVNRHKGKTWTNRYPWLVNPELKPDVYETSAQKVTFISDCDSISFNVEPGGVYDFAVLLNGRDSAYTRIEGISDNPLEDPPARIRTISPSGLLSRRQAQFDINALIYAISEIHPSMFHTCGQERLMAAADSVKRSLPDSLTRSDLFLAAAPLVAMIGDGHTCLRPPVVDDERWLPMDIEVGLDDYTLHVSRCIDNIIPENAEVTAINGIPARTMLEHMMEGMSGERYFFRLARVESYFQTLFQLMYKADEYTVEYRKSGSRKTRKAVLPATRLEEIRSRIAKKKNRYEGRDAYSFTIMKDKGVAVMDFLSMENHGRMRTFADSMFTVLHDNGIRNLIIDIRDNGGGNSLVGDELLRHISPRPFKQFAKSFVRITPTTLRNSKMTETAPGLSFHDSGDNNMTEPFPDGKGRFNGNVYLLISHRTFSSASSFSWAFRQFGMGTVIGEESGGMNVSFGDNIYYRMPISNLQCTISFKRFWLYGADEHDIHGTMPDVAVPADRAMEKALEIIGNTGS